MMVNSLIDHTLESINRDYQPGTLPWIKGNRPEKWEEMLTLEGKVNEMVLGGNIEGLREALNEYQRIILAMVKEFKKGRERAGNV
jgi:hypothetical protein